MKKKVSYIVKKISIQPLIASKRRGHVDVEKNRKSQKEYRGSQHEMYERT
jgi:hypothetical protein